MKCNQTSIPGLNSDQFKAAVIELFQKLPIHGAFLKQLSAAHIKKLSP